MFILAIFWLMKQKQSLKDGFQWSSREIRGAWLGLHRSCGDHAEGNGLLPTLTLTHKKRTHLCWVNIPYGWHIHLREKKTVWTWLQAMKWCEHFERPLFLSICWAMISIQRNHGDPKHSKESVHSWCLYHVMVCLIPSVETQSCQVK